MGIRNAKSPYLASDKRLADVIAAIQAAGTYKYYKLDFVGWSDRISGDESKADHWRRVFVEHPEFFRLDSARQRGSLILRRQRQRLYNVDDDAVWARRRYDALPEAAKQRFSRLPLAAPEIEALIDVAISLHARATERERDRRWLVAPMLGFIGAIFGGLVAKGLELAVPRPDPPPSASAAVGKVAVPHPPGMQNRP